MAPAAIAEVQSPRLPSSLGARRVAVPLALALTFFIVFGKEWLPAWLLDYPEAWNLQLHRWITSFIEWILKDLDFGLFTFRQMTRGISAAIAEPMLLVKGLLVGGLTFDRDSAVLLTIPPLSWVSIIGLFALLGYYVKNAPFALLVGLAFLYMAVFGLWESAMMTLASIFVAVSIGTGFGILLGIWSYKYRRVERVLTPLFDIMQTMPSFAYLVPALMLFGHGPVAAVLVTMIYAMPPMARATTLSLRSVPLELQEFGSMVGCTNRQMLYKVLMPASRQTLMVGVNQVIMLSLNVVIIASVIGAGGLGFDVWQALQKLAIGKGVEAGLAITLMAIALDRLSQEFVVRGPRHARERKGPLSGRHFALLAVAVLVIPTLLGLVVPLFHAPPSYLLVSTGQFWDGVVSWINLNLFEVTEVIKNWTILNVIRPFKEFLLSLPWVGVVAVVSALGLWLSGPRLAAMVGGLGAFIAVVGLWDRAMVSMFLVSICVALSCAIGIPLGIYAATNRRAERVLTVIIDTAQTLPTFVYLIPVVMLFSVGDFAGMVTITIYAIAPAIRYTNLGLRLVRPELIEAACASGCTRGQILRKVQLPLALPEIMLGVNQTIMMALSMVVISALVGTRGLEQEILISLSKVNPGQGLVAGLCIACIAMIADRLITAWSERKRRALGRLT